MGVLRTLDLECAGRSTDCFKVCKIEPKQKVNLIIFCLRIQEYQPSSNSLLHSKGPVRNNKSSTLKFDNDVLNPFYSTFSNNHC